MRYNRDRRQRTLVGFPWRDRRNVAILVSVPNPEYEDEVLVRLKCYLGWISRNVQFTTERRTILLMKSLSGEVHFGASDTSGDNNVMTNVFQMQNKHCHNKNVKHVRWGWKAQNGLSTVGKPTTRLPFECFTLCRIECPLHHTVAPNTYYQQNVWHCEWNLWLCDNILTQSTNHCRLQISIASRVIFLALRQLSLSHHIHPRPPAICLKKESQSEQVFYMACPFWKSWPSKYNRKVRSAQSGR